MKIAFFSDIHANLPALEAFFKSVDSKEIDAIYCLGDLVGYNTWPDEVVAEIRKRRIPTIAGNHDLKVKKLRRDENREVDYAYHIGSDEARSFLSTLPRFLRIDFELAEENISVLLVHGSPRSVSEYLLEDIDENYVKELLTEADVDIILCGHTHKPYKRAVYSDGKFKYLINIGAVGKPKDGDPRGCYVLLNLHQHSTLRQIEGIEVEFVRFEYDVEKAAQAVENSPLPREFADRLRKAY